MKRLITMLMCLAATTACGQTNLLDIEQFVEPIAVSNSVRAVFVREPVVDRQDASNRITELETDTDFFGAPPDELAYDAKWHVCRNAEHIPCETELIAQHRSKKAGLLYFVELESDDGLAIYVLKAEKQQDVDRLKAKCEARSGKTLKVKDKKLKE